MLGCTTVHCARSAAEEDDEPNTRAPTWWDGSQTVACCRSYRIKETLRGYLAVHVGCPLGASMRSHLAGAPGGDMPTAADWRECQGSSPKWPQRAVWGLSLGIYTLQKLFLSEWNGVSCASPEARGHLTRTDQYLSRCWNADQALPRRPLRGRGIDLWWRGTQGCQPHCLCLALWTSVCLSAASEPQTVVLRSICCVSLFCVFPQLSGGEGDGVGGGVL